MPGGYLKTSSTGSFNFIKLDKEEELIQSLVQFALDSGKHTGFITGIGVLKDVELGYFDVEKKKYDVKSFKGEYELLSMMGNIALTDGKPLPHVHVVLSGEDFKAFGGHLVRGYVGVTCEMVMAAVDIRIERIYDSETGLKLLTPSQEVKEK